RSADDVLEAIALAELLRDRRELLLATLELAVIVLDLVGAELEQIAELIDLLVGHLRNLANGLVQVGAVAAAVRDFADLAHEQLGRLRRERFVDAATDEEE